MSNDWEAARSVRYLADAICPPLCKSRVNGNTVGSLAEAIMGMTDSLQRIAGAMEKIAAVEERQQAIMEGK